MMCHVPGLLILRDLEATLCVSVFTRQSQVVAAVALAAGLTESLLAAAGREGHLLVSVSAREVVRSQASVAS